METRKNAKNRENENLTSNRVLTYVKWFHNFSKKNIDQHLLVSLYLETRKIYSEIFYI